jgi:hypothetical protein
MGITWKRYDATYKKRTDIDEDSYLPGRSPKEIIQCSGCGAFYHRRHWMLTPPAGFHSPVHRHLIFCPACRKIKEHSASGELQLLGTEDADRGEVLRILRNEELRAREKNPLERIMRVEQMGNGWKVQTTTEKLAQRLGRSVCKARGGKIAYKWSHNNKFVRVIWEKNAPPVGS